MSPKELSFLGFCTDGGCFAFSKWCSPDLGFSPLPGARQKEGGGFLFSNPGRNSSECQGFFTCSFDSTRSANYMTSVRIGNLYSSGQLILPEACIEMPGIVSSASENYTGGGAVTDGMCTQTVSCVQKHIHAYIQLSYMRGYTRKHIYQYRDSNLVHPASLKRGL